MHKDLPSLRMKTETNVQIEYGFTHTMNQSARPHFKFCIKFVINGKVISLHRIIQYVKRSKSSFDDFIANQTPCES